MLVESVQSMANHAEATTWSAGSNDPRAELDGLPYVQVVTPDGEFLTSSRVEAHRLASAYIMNATLDGRKGVDWLPERLGLHKGQPLDFGRVARAVFELDPLSLVHGVFFAQSKWPWQPRIARVLTVFVEAYDVQPAFSGGVKSDRVQSGKFDASSGRASEEGYGMVPHQRTEYTARRIVAHVNVDHEQIRSYALGSVAEEVLEAVVAFELANLFAEGLRLRTACDLVVQDVRGGVLLPSSEASERLRDAIDAAAAELGDVTTVVFGGR